MLEERVDAEKYLSICSGKLSESGYILKNNISYKNQTFRCMARKTTFEMGRYGFFSMAFVFSKLGNPDFDQLKEVSSKSYKYAKGVNWLHPPPGFLYGLLCIPVVIADFLSYYTINDIRQKSLPIYWGASVKLAVFDLSKQKLYYCETNPSLGLLYHEYDRQIIKDALITG
jgi:hypothetical protein